MDETIDLKKRMNESPVLVFDRSGELGKKIVFELAKEFLCIFVSRMPQDRTENIIHIPLTKRIPTIPKCTYKSFFLVYNGDKYILDLLPSFAQKAKEDNAHVYFILTVREVRGELVEKIRDISSLITILLVGDIFDTDSVWNNPVNRILSQSRTGRIVLRNNGLSFVYPIARDDVCSVLRRLTHLKGVTGHRILYLLPPHSVTEISFARILHKKEPLLKIDIDDSKEQSKDYTPKKYTSVFGSTYAFAGKLPPVIVSGETYSASNEKKRTKTGHMQKRIFQQSIKNFLYISIFSLVALFFCLPIVSAFAAYSFLARTRLSVYRNDWEKARASANAATHLFGFAKNYSMGVRIMDLLGWQQAENIIAGIETGKTVSETIASGINGLSLLKKVFMAESLDPKQDFSIGMQSIKNALVRFSALQAEGKLPQQFEKYTTEFSKLNLVSLFDVLPHLFGMDGRRKYLVLFQNNMELRPGGGFIGSYGVMSIDKGRIVDFPIHDVYDADGQLREHFDPPYQLRRYLGANHWFLRDSNFDVDFPKSGAAASFFYNAETKDVVDGVVAIDVSFIRNLLSLIGPVKVVGYNEEVSAKNFFLLTESYAQDNFFPGSRKKQDFLKAVAASLFSRLQVSPQDREPSQVGSIPYLPIAKAFADSVSQKHLLFAFPDESIQRIFSLSGMSSSITDTRVDAKGRVNDFLGINEANLGANKVNYYLDRSISHLVKFGFDEFYSETVTVQYNNRSTLSDKYGGDYKAYVRFILPLGAELTSVTLNDNDQEIVPMVTDVSVFTSPAFRPESKLEVEQAEYSGKTVFGFLIIVPQSGKKKVAISYTVPMSVNPDLKTEYSLRVFKQPGTEGDPYSFTFTTPHVFKILNASEALKTTAWGVSMLTTLAEDRDIEINLVKK